eukprot:6477582-Amphidinium_carterae.1
MYKCAFKNLADMRSESREATGISKVRMQQVKEKQEVRVQDGHQSELRQELKGIEYEGMFQKGQP